jgi:2-polyprenyl-6-methoxyphenol hydroxylase-like FAD-dependent oxidoreductase
MAVAALRALPDSAAHFSTRVADLEPRDDRVRVVALGADGPRDFTADWVICSDGGRSSVRRMRTEPERSEAGGAILDLGGQMCG